MTLPFEQLVPLLAQETWVTLYMTFLSTFFAYLLGLPLGILVSITDKEGLTPNIYIHGILSTLVNVLRSAPFLILMMTVTPLSRAIVGVGYGPNATIVALTISAFPYVGRLVENSLKEVDPGVVEAMRSMGASPFQIIRKALLPEALPGLLTGATLATTTILGYSAMAGAIGGGGLGAIAINYGYHRYEYMVMIFTLGLLILLVQIIQMLGNALARAVDRRR